MTDVQLGGDITLPFLTSFASSLAGESGEGAESAGADSADPADSFGGNPAKLSSVCRTAFAGVAWKLLGRLRKGFEMTRRSRLCSALNTETMSLSLIAASTSATLRTSRSFVVVWKP